MVDITNTLLSHDGITNILLHTLKYLSHNVCGRQFQPQLSMEFYYSTYLFFDIF